MPKPYFKNIREEIIKQLAYAQNSVYVAVAWFTDKELFEILLDLATKRGINVYLLILDDEINEGANIPFEKLNQVGSKFYSMPVGYLGNSYARMHHKFCIIDGKNVIMGSFNWTNQANNNQESIIIIENEPDSALEFINQFNQLIDTLPTVQSISNELVLYDTQELEILKIELKMLEVITFHLNTEKAEIEQHIYNFNIEYYHQLGHLLQEILKLEMLIAEKNKKSEYEHKKQQYEEFTDQFNQAQQIELNKLNDEEEAELKQFYKKGAKLCHPDKYQDEAIKQKVQEWFIKIADAYQNKDLKALREIIEALENQDFDKYINFEKTSSAEMLKAKIALFKAEKDSILELIANLKQSVPYDVVSNMKLWNNYFETQKALLVTKIKSLESQCQIN
jgi:hypothetical protein